MRLGQRATAPALALALVLALACDEGGEATSSGGDDPCGPTRARVARVIDGDTVELEGGERVRYLMIDTPESTQGKLDCFGHEAAELNRQHELLRDADEPR